MSEPPPRDPHLRLVSQQQGLGFGEQAAAAAPSFDIFNHTNPDDPERVEWSPVWKSSNGRMKTGHRMRAELWRVLLKTQCLVMVELTGHMPAPQEPPDACLDVVIDEHPQAMFWLMNVRAITVQLAAGQELLLVGRARSGSSLRLRVRVRTT